jgi:hypothetical protein
MREIEQHELNREWKETQTNTIMAAKRKHTSTKGKKASRRVGGTHTHTIDR